MCSKRSVMILRYSLSLDEFEYTKIVQGILKDGFQKCGYMSVGNRTNKILKFVKNKIHDKFS